MIRLLDRSYISLQMSEQQGGEVKTSCSQPGCGIPVPHRHDQTNVHNAVATVRCPFVYPFSFGSFTLTGEDVPT
jgi:hypothetical protein